MRLYEVILIFKPDFTKEKLEEGIQQASSLVKKHGGEVKEVKKQDKRALQYAIEKKKEGWFVLLYVNLDPAKVPALRRDFKLADYILRDMVVLEKSLAT